MFMEDFNFKKELRLYKIRKIKNKPQSKQGEFIDWIKRNTYVTEWKHPIGEKLKIYASKIDDSYITNIGLEKELLTFFNKGINELQMSRPDGRTATIGYSDKDNKWYGWSHRAIYGFTIGSEVKKGDCGYFASNLEDWIQSEINFWVNYEYHNSYSYELKDDKLIIISPYNDKNKTLRGTIYTHESYIPKKWGKGEWVAKTMDDAKQMAIDFARGVS